MTTGIMFIPTIAVILALLSILLILSGVFGKVTLNTNLKDSEGYLGVPEEFAAIVGKEGVAYTSLRPAGKIMVNGTVYDAVAEYGGMIDKDAKIYITRYEAGQLYCTKQS